MDIRINGVTCCIFLAGIFFESSINLAAPIHNAGNIGIK